MKPGHMICEEGRRWWWKGEGGERGEDGGGRRRETVSWEQRGQSVHSSGMRREWGTLLMMAGMCGQGVAVEGEE